MDRSIIIARFHNAQDNQVRQQEGPWSRLAGRLTQHVERGGKDGPLWSPTIYRPGTTRGKANVLFVTCLVLDFDHGAPPEEFARGWDRWTYAMHTTHSHSEDDPKWRAVFPFIRPVPADEWPDLWQRLVKRFGGNAVDKQCKDASRIYYLPSCAPGAPRAAHEQEGEWLDPDEFRRPTVDTLLQGARGRTSEGRNAAGMWLACQMRDNGYDARDAEAVAWEAEVPREKVLPDGRVDLYEREEWLSTVRKAYARPPRDPWTPGLPRSSPEPKPVGIQQAVNGKHSPEGLPPPRRPETVPLGILMRKEFAPMRWAVPDMIGEGLTLLAGGTKAGKSYLALSAAVAVAAGGKVFGKLPVEAGQVLYLALEDSQRRLQDRLHDILRGDEPPEGMDLSIEWPMLGRGFEDYANEWLDAHNRARLIVVDVLQKVRPPRLKNSEPYDEDYRITAMLQRIALPRHVALLALHHTRKMAADDPFDLISGSAGMTAAADGLMVLMRQRDQPEATLHFIGRDVSAQAWSLRWDGDTRNWSMLGDAVLHQVSQQRVQVMRLLKEMNEDMGPRDIAEMLHTSYASIRQLLARMSREGEVSRTTRGKYRLPPSIRIEAAERGMY